MVASCMICSAQSLGTGKVKASPFYRNGMFGISLNSQVPTRNNLFTYKPMKFNQEQVAKRQNLKPREVLAEYDQTQAKVRELVKQIPIETRRTRGILPWYGDEFDLEDMISITNYGHKREHCAQIAIFRSTLKLG